jgi:MFS family permease
VLDVSAKPRLTARIRDGLHHWQLLLVRFFAGLHYRLREVRLSDLVRRPRIVGRLRDKTDRNIWYLYVEVFWAGIFMAVIAFNATYALRLGASNAMIGWLSSVPALLAIAVLVPAARLLETKSNRAPWLRGSLYLGRAAFIGAALSPWVIRGRVAEAVVAVLILRTIPMTFYSAGFEPLLADVVPLRDRALVVSTRNIIQGVTIAACTFLFGKWLDVAAGIPWAVFPVNYQLLYIVGTVAGVLSAYFVAQIEVPETPVIARTRVKRKAPARLRTLSDTVRAAARENRDFFRMMTNTFVFNFGAWLLGPLYIIFFVNQLRASDGWVGLNTTLAQIGVIFGYLLWRRVMDRRGISWTLRFTVPLSAGYAFLVAFFPNLNLILIWGILINLVNSGLNLSHGTALYLLCPAERRASYMAIFSTISNVGAFVAPMLGVALSAAIDIRWILLIGGVIRLLGAGLFHLFPIRTMEAEMG